MEPLSTVILSAAAGGAAGKMMERAWDSGGKWLAERFRGHQETARVQAERNALAFLTTLAQRVQKIEDDEGGEGRKKVDRALDDPDFSAVLQSALLSAARSSSEDKHEILSRAVAEKLESEPEGLVSLTSSLAVESLPYLSAHHLSTLALAVFVDEIRVAPEALAGSRERAEITYLRWLERMLSLLLPDARFHPRDLGHLAAVSCVGIRPAPSRVDLSKQLRPVPFSDRYSYPSEEFFSSNECGKALRQIYERALSRFNLTTAGRLIGIYTFDLRTGSDTKIDWDHTFQETDVVVVE